MAAWREAAVARAATEQDLELREEIQAEDEPEAPKLAEPTEDEPEPEAGDPPNARASGAAELALGQRVVAAWREAAAARAATEQDLELREEIQAEDEPKAPEPLARTRDGQAPMATEDGMGDQANTGAEHV